MPDEYYNPDSVCPKCGYGEVGTSFHSGIYDVETGRMLDEREECIYRRCTRCTYGWKEVPLDQ